MRSSIVLAAVVMAAFPCVGQSVPAAKAPAAKPRAEAPLTDGMACSPFLWGADGADRPEAKMLVPVTIDGKPFVYQLDTGSDEVTVYGSQAHPEWKPLAQGVRMTDLQFAGMTLRSVVAYPLPAVPDTEAQGSIGLDPLVGKVLVIDFPRRRVCLSEAADVPPAVVRAAQWNGAEVRHGKFFVRAEINGKRSNRLAFDTGAMGAGLVMDLEPWKAATGKSGVAEATGKFSSSIWGNAVEYVSAPLTGDMVVSNRVFEHPQVATAPLRDKEYVDTFQADGVLGTGPFHDSIVILDLTGHARFGLIYPAQ